MPLHLQVRQQVHEFPFGLPDALGEGGVQGRPVETVRFLLFDQLLEPAAGIIAGPFHGIDPNGSAMIRNSLGIDHAEAKPLHHILHRLDRIEAQVLVVDRVILQRVDQIKQIVRLGNERAPVPQQRMNAAETGTEVGDMRKDVGGRNQGCRPFLL